MLVVFLYSVVVSVSFSRLAYSINEDDGSVQAKLLLNMSVGADITVQVRTNDNTATGK